MSSLIDKMKEIKSIENQLNLLNDQKIKLKQEIYQFLLEEIYKNDVLNQSHWNINSDLFMLYSEVDKHSKIADLLQNYYYNTIMLDKYVYLNIANYNIIIKFPNLTALIEFCKNNNLSTKG